MNSRVMSPFQEHYNVCAREFGQACLLAKGTRRRLPATAFPGWPRCNPGAVPESVLATVGRRLCRRGGTARQMPRCVPAGNLPSLPAPDRQVCPSRTRGASCEVSLGPLTAHLAEHGGAGAGGRSGGGGRRGFGDGGIPNLSRYTVRRGWLDIWGYK